METGMKLYKIEYITNKQVKFSREAVLSVLPMFSSTQRAQTEVPGACLWVGNPQFGDISGGVHREEKPRH